MPADPVRIVPTWGAVVPILAEVAANAERVAARDEAMAELRRLAALADGLLPAAVAVCRIIAAANDGQKVEDTLQLALVAGRAARAVLASVDKEEGA